MKTVNNLKSKVLMLSAVFLVAAGSAWSDEKKEAGKDCIQLTQIRETKAIDDQNILVFAGPNRVFKNHLPNKCNGLIHADSYMYKTSQSQLCSLDVITALNRFGGDFSKGSSCGLGKFELIDQKTADDLLSAKK